MIFEHIPNVVLINIKATKKNVDFAHYFKKLEYYLKQP